MTNTTTIPITPIADEVHTLLAQLGVPPEAYSSGDLTVHTPITGEAIAQVPRTTPSATAEAIRNAHRAYLEWRNVPAPKRGELIRLLGDELRAALPQLGRLVTIETGKILSEGLGEVQEMIDICGFASGLSRQLAGLTLPSERPSHRMMETWHPLGAIGVISAFNFPVAVWAWNAALALVCGDAVVWKASEKTPLTALATHAIFQRAAAKFGGAPSGLAALLIGDAGSGEQLVDSPLIPLVSATGSTVMAAPSLPGWQPVSPAPFSSSAATTPPSSHPPPTSISPFAPSPSPRWVPQDSAARPSGASSFTSRSTTPSSHSSRKYTRQ
jgi:aldehyde dehydrogenase (NAD+)